VPEAAIEATLVEVAAESAGRYLLKEPLGRGSVGEVWRAEDPGIGRQVAVKILQVPQGLSAEQRSEWERRFLREARAAGRLSHPGIVPVHDVGEMSDGRPFIVMELIEGQSLDAIMKSGRPPSPRTVLTWGAEVGEALDAAHQRGIVHRDIKPANILVDAEGHARIADFGIARVSESDLTREGLFLGSPAFASPEQLRGSAVDGRADLFSLGATLYALLAGVRPFKGDDISSLAYAICHVEPEPPSSHARHLPPGCDAVLMKALAKEPDRRHRTGRELAAELRAIAEGRPASSSGANAAVGSKAAVLLARATVTAAAATRAVAVAIVAASRASLPIFKWITCATRGVTARAWRGGLDLWSRGWRRGPRVRVAMIGCLVITLAGLAFGGAALFRRVESRRESPGTRIKKAFSTLFSGLGSTPGRAVPEAIPDGDGPRILAARSTPATPAPMRPAIAEPAGSVPVRVSAVHGITDGQLTIWSAGRRVLTEHLEAEKKGVEAFGARLLSYRRSEDEWPMDLSPGWNRLRVRVTSSERNLDLQREISKALQADGRYRLEVRVKTWPSPRLDLEWFTETGA
jgi:hypothetical protein